MNKSTEHTADALYMQRCLQLASQGRPACRTNPMVGCCIVHNGRILAEGYHRVFGQAHAEVDALSRVDEKDKQLLADATLYVNLAPCNHTGKTPPCTEAILKSGIRRVVVGMEEIHAQADGGIQRLREAGIVVITNVEQTPATHLNQHFHRIIQDNRPYITLKWAESVHGVMGSTTERLYLSNDQTQRWTHDLRRQHNAILIGRGTLELDNPSLTTRAVPGSDPLRVLLAGERSLQFDYKLFTDGGSTLVVSPHSSPADKPGHVSWITMSNDEKSLHRLCQRLVEEYDIGFLLVEGGAQVHSSFIEAGLWDEAWRIIAPNSENEGILAPQIPRSAKQQFRSGSDVIEILRNT